MNRSDPNLKAINRNNRELARLQRHERDIAALQKYDRMMNSVERHLNQLQKHDRIMNNVSKTYLRQLSNLGKLPVVDQQRVRSIVEPVQQAMAKNMGSFASAVAPRLPMKNFIPQSSVSQMLRGINLSALTPSVPIIPKLPNPVDMKVLRGILQQAAEAAEQAREAAALGDETLEASGYGFADHMWSWLFVASFAHVHPRVRDAVVTRRMAAITSSETFQEWLAKEIQESRLLKPRWQIIEQALAAHRRKEYVLSTPVLLAQIEGTIGDAMILKNRVLARDGKLYLLDNDGELKLNKKGRPIEIRGLHSLVDLSDFSDHEALEDAASLLTDSLAPWRNAILHGRNVKYGRAKLSVQALLMLWLLATEVRAFEEAKLPRDPADP